MWFNVIKNTARDRAYQSFIRSFILYDRVSLNPEHIEAVEEGDEVKVRWYTPNRAWYWEFFVGSHRDSVDSTLGTTIKEHEPYTYFITNAMREEYPDNWQVFSDLYRDNRDTIKEKLYKEEEEVVEEEETRIPRAVFRQTREIFMEFADTIATKINESLPPMQGSGRVRRVIRELFHYKPTIMQISREFSRRTGNRQTAIRFELLQSVYMPFIRNVRNEHSHFTFEHIANLYVHFREAMIQELRGTTREEIFNSILDYDTEGAYLITLRIWEEEEANRQLLMDNLPIDRILN